MARRKKAPVYDPADRSALRALRVRRVPDWPRPVDRPSELRRSIKSPPPPPPDEARADLFNRNWYVARAVIEQSINGFGDPRITISADLIAIAGGVASKPQVGNADLLIDILEGVLAGLRGIPKSGTSRGARVPKKQAESIRRRLARGDRV